MSPRLALVILSTFAAANGGACVVEQAPQTPAQGSPAPHSQTPPTDTAGEVAQPRETGAATPEQAKSVTSAGNQFGMDLYRRVAGDSGNIAISPASIHIALGMTMAGARDATYAEMAGVMNLQAMKPESIHPGFATMRKQFEAIDGDNATTLRAANRLFGQVGTFYLKPFLQTTERHYGAALEMLRFFHAA